VGFYQAVFEWEVSRPDSAYALLDAKPVAIGLVQGDDSGSGGPTIIVATPNLELTHARVMQYGGVIRQSIAPSWRGRQFRFVDPDGNELVAWSDKTTGGGAP
jgi:predicted enzyme related to lactoylglutathione lyase